MFPLLNTKRYCFFWYGAMYPSHTEKISRDGHAKTRLTPCFLVVTRVAGKPPRPPSSDGQSSVFVLVRIRSLPNPLAGVVASQKIARRFACPIGFRYHSRSGRHW
jgi:hypothetical protein